MFQQWPCTSSSHTSVRESIHQNPGTSGSRGASRREAGLVWSEGRSLEAAAERGDSVAGGEKPGPGAGQGHGTGEHPGAHRHRQHLGQIPVVGAERSEWRWKYPTSTLSGVPTRGRKGAWQELERENLTVQSPSRVSPH